MESNTGPQNTSYGGSSRVYLCAVDTKPFCTISERNINMLMQNLYPYAYIYGHCTSMEATSLWWYEKALITADS